MTSVVIGQDRPVDSNHNVGHCPSGRPWSADAGRPTYFSGFATICRHPSTPAVTHQSLFSRSRSMTVDLDKLEQLDCAATPRPWFDDGHVAGNGSVVMSEATGFRVAHLPDTAKVKNHEADAAFIAAACNAVPELVQRVRAAEAALMLASTKLIDDEAFMAKFVDEHEKKYGDEKHVTTCAVVRDLAGSRRMNIPTFFTLYADQCEHDYTQCYVGFDDEFFIVCCGETDCGKRRIAVSRVFLTLLRVAFDKCRELELERKAK